MQKPFIYTLALAALLLAPAFLHAQPSCAPVSTRCVGSGQEYTTIQAAADAAVAGDLVFVFNGSYTGFQIGTSTSHVSGTALNPITFQGQSNTSTIINVAGNVAGDGINVTSVDYVVIDGFNIPNMGRCGIKMALSTGSVAKNNIIDAAHDQDILLGFTPRMIVQDNVLTGAVVQHGLYVSNSNIGFDGIIVRRNITSGNALNGIQFNGDCTTLDPSGNSDGMLSGLLVEDNISFGNGARGFAIINASNSTFRNNLLYGNSTSNQIALADQGCNLGSNNNLFTNNTIYAGTGTGIRVISGINNVFFNNLVVANSFKCVIDASATPCDAFAGGNNYNNNKDLTTSTITGVFTNQAGSDYTLASGSSAIGAGVSTYAGYAAPLVDLLNNGRPVSGTYDAGAYEFAGTAAGTDTTPPTTPGSLTITPTAYQAGITWTASTDAFGVIGYIINRDGVPYASALTNSYSDTTVVPGTTYAYTVTAYDAAPNLSAASSGSTTVFGQIGCMNADTTFRTILMPLETGTFTFAFDSKPFGVPNSVIGLSAATPTQFSSMAVIVAFLSGGTIVARNGSSYTGDITLNWSTSVSYHFRLVIRIASHTYDVFVTPSSGGGELTLATNYAFRTEQAAVTSLGYVTTNDSGGTTSVCTPLLNGVSITGISYLSVSNQALATQVITTVLSDANGSGKPLLDVPKPNVLTGNYTLTTADNGALLYYGGSSTITVTVPTGLGAGFGCTTAQDSTGIIQFAGSGLVVVNRSGATHTAGTGSAAVIQCTSANSCKLWGDVQ